MSVWTLDWTVRDRQNAPSHVIQYLPGNATQAQVIAYFDLVTPLLDDMIDGAISAMNATFDYVNEELGIKSAALDNADRSEGGLFVFRTELANYTRTRIPTFKESQITVGTELIDLVNPEVSAWLTAVFAGTGGIAPCDSRGEDITETWTATEDFKRYTKKYASA